MKKKTKLLSLISTTLAGFALSVGALSFQKKAISTKAVDINDYTACETAHKNNSGSSMLKALREITAPGSAGSYAQLWETYKKAYIRSDGKIFDYYSNISNFRPGTDQAGSYSKEGDVYNREHSIPKSWWGGAEKNQGADPFIVVPTDGYVNNKRSNYPMGPVGSASYQSANGFSKLGSVKSGYGYSGTVFEPDDSVKGDFARIVFYAIAKYSASYDWTSGEGSSTFSGSASTNYGLTNYAIKFYSEWSAQDPVSDWERSVNDAIAPIQGNRNPFIDHPEYANTLWGTNSNYTPYPEDSKTLTSISLSNKTTSYEVGDTFIKPTVTASYDDSSTKDVTDSATFSGYNLNNTGYQTVTVSYTEGGVTKTASYSINVTASTKTLTSISVSGQKTSFNQNSAFSFGGTVTATYSNGTQADVTDSATFSGYNMSQTGNQTVTVSYTYSGLIKTTTYGIEVVESQSGQGEETTLEISFTGSESSSTDAKGNVWSANGDFTTGSSYLRLNKETSYISNGTPLMVDTSDAMTVTASLRTYGGANSQSLKITAYNDQNAAISNTLTLSPKSSSLAIYSGTLTFTSSTDHEVYIKAYSGNNYSLGISGMSFNYMSWEESTAPTLSGISVATSPTKTTYTAGETFDPIGLVITRTYSNSTSDQYAYAGHASEFSFSPSTSTALTTSNTSVTITYGGKTCSQAITVNAAKTLSSISVSTAPTKTTYTAGESFDPTGLVIRRNFSDSTYDTYTYANHTSEFTFSPSTSTALTTSNTSVTITYGGKSTTQAITVNAATKTLSSISISGYTTSFTVDEAFSFGGTVTAHFSDSSTSDVTGSATFGGYDMSVAGNYTVTVSYTYGGTTKTTSYQITVTSSGGSGGGESEDFSATYNYSNQGTAWTLTDCEDKGDYWLCPSSGDSSVALIKGIFTDKNITSSVVITINSGTYGSGSNPSESTFTIYNSSACSSQVSSTQTGTLPTSKTYTNAIYTVSLANASNFTDDLAIEITKPGKQIRLNSIEVEFTYETAGSSEPITSITATPNKTFYVGETINASDITVKGQANQTVTDFTFTPYTFKYSDAASGGALTNVLMSVSYETLNANFYAQVQRKAYSAPTGTQSLEHTGSEFSSAGIGSSYATGQTATVDGIQFNVDGYVYSGTKLSLSQSKTSAPGKVVNTAPYPSGITNVTVNGASPDIQLSTDGSTWVDLASAQTSTTNYYYLKLFYKTTSQSNYVNIISFTVTMKAFETPDNVANYIMYEDTNNQCVSKLPIALGYYKNLSTSRKSEFQTSDDYVISTARERLNAWADAQGKTINYSSGELSSKSNLFGFNVATENGTTIIVVVALISTASLTMLLFIKKRRMH